MVGGLNVDRCDVVRQQHDLVGMQFTRVFAFYVRWGDQAGLQQPSEKGSCAGEAVKNMYAFIGQTAPELLARDIVRRTQDEIDDFDWGVDDAESIGLLLERSLKELLVEVSDEALLTLGAD